MRDIYELSGPCSLRKARLRAVRAWKARCRSVVRRRRLIRLVLAAALAAELLWFREGPGITGWARQQWPDVRYIEEIQTRDRETERDQEAERDQETERDQAAVRRELNIRLDGKGISIFRIEESPVEPE